MVFWWSFPGWFNIMYSRLNEHFNIQFRNIISTWTLFKFSLSFGFYLHFQNLIKLVFHRNNTTVLVPHNQLGQFMPVWPPVQLITVAQSNYFFLKNVPPLLIIHIFCLSYLFLILIITYNFLPLWITFHWANTQISNFKRLSDCVLPVSIDVFCPQILSSLQKNNFFQETWFYDCNCWLGLYHRGRKS